MLPGALWLLHLPKDKQQGIERFLKAKKSLKLRLCLIQMLYRKGMEVAVAGIYFRLNTDFQRLLPITLSL